MGDRLKVLDCDRKAVLGLPDAAFKLWMCYWMHENDVQQSYVSLRTVQKVTGLDTKTIMKWQRWMLERGWLVDTGETAADVYGKKATRGSKKVRVLRVDDPTKGVSVSQTAKNAYECQSSDSSVGNIPTVNGQWENVLHPKSPTKVYCSGSGSESCSKSGYSSAPPAISKAENQNQNQNQPQSGSRLKTCKACGSELKKDENHLLVCPVLNPPEPHDPACPCVECCS